jgi:hypothetical protein
MKSFNDYLTEMNRPGSGMPFQSRDLEGFRSILDSLKVQTKGVMDPEIKQKIYTLVNPFYEEMAKLLASYKAQGQGYSDRYQYQGTTGVMGTPDSNF